MQLLVNNRSDENNGLGEGELLKGDKYEAKREVLHTSIIVQVEIRIKQLIKLEKLLPNWQKKSW